MSIRIAFAAALLVAANAMAQENNVFDPKARSPGVAFRSAFEDYRPFAEQKPAGWREANEEVRRAAQKPPARPEAGHGGQHK